MSHNTHTTHVVILCALCEGTGLYRSEFNYRMHSCGNCCGTGLIKVTTITEPYYPPIYDTIEKGLEESSDYKEKADWKPKPTPDGPF